MTSQKLFSDALQLLEAGSIHHGEDKLRSALSVAEREGKRLVVGGALYCLGGLLVDQQRTQEAVPLLEQLAAMEHENALTLEVDRAHELLVNVSA